MQNKYSIVIILLLFFAVRLTAATVPISIYSPDFSPTYIDNWTLNGHSTVVNDALRLTDDVTNQSATTFWTAEICNADGFKFSAYFEFLIDKSNSQADGITFILQQYSNTFGSLGEGIGYGDLPGKSIAIEYDTYKNSNRNDPDNGHIAVDIEGQVNHDTNAAYMGIPKTDMLVTKSELAGMGIDLADHNVKYTWIDYDGTNLQVRISTSPARPVNPIIDIEFDLASYFDGASTFFGFGSATGASREKHFINSVYIHNRYAPIDVSANTYEQGDFSTNSVTTDTICEGESYLFNGIEFTTDTVYTVNLMNSVGCDSTATLILDVRPLLTTWTGALSQEWFNDNNWNPKFPTVCTHVIIPDVGNGVNYPIIDGPAECLSITFEPGGGVLGLQYLSYTKAYVQLQLQPGKWYTLTAPLKSMFSGDYYFEGNPRTYMRLFDDVNPDIEGDTIAVGTWTQPFANNEVPLSSGVGFAFLVDSFSYNYPNGSLISNDDYKIYFPREIGKDTLMTEVVPISGITGKPYPSIAETLPKDSAYAYRFAMENAENVLEDVRVPIKEGLNLIGNPLMTHLDFNLLYASNEDKIENKLRFWNGTTFTTYMAGTALSSSLNTDYTRIPPMQAFIVQAKSTVSEDTQLDINLGEHFVIDEVTKLRAANSSAKVMHIVSSRNGLSSSTALAYNESASNSYGDEDAFKLFTQYEGVPDIYTVASDKALDINQFGEMPIMVPIGIKSTESGTINLSFYGADAFKDVDVTLLNTMTGEQQNLKADSEYNLEFDGSATDGSLFVEFRAANSVTETPESEMCGIHKCIQVFAQDDAIYAISPDDDMIKKMTIWEEAGKQLYCNDEVNKSEFKTHLNTTCKICVVRVQTETRTMVIKVLMEK